MFKPEIQKLFSDAGWFPGRNVANELSWPYYKDDYPDELKEFLLEYGNLIVVGTAYVPARITFEPDMAEEFDLDEGRYFGFITEETGQEYFLIGLHAPDASYVLADENMHVYLFGDVNALFGKTLKEGIENILESNWKSAIEYDVSLGKWLDYDGHEVDLD